jgi:hypothetical protein
MYFNFKILFVDNIIKMAIYLKPKRQKKITEISFELTDWNYFSVKMTQYEQSLLDLFRTVIGREYNPNGKLWSFPLSSYDYIILNVKELTNVNIQQQLTEEQVKSIQAIIVEETESDFFIDLPHHAEDAKDLVKNFGGVNSMELYRWSLKSDV